MSRLSWNLGGGRDHLGGCVQALGLEVDEQFGGCRVGGDGGDRAEVGWRLRALGAVGGQVEEPVTGLDAVVLVGCAVAEGAAVER